MSPASFADGVGAQAALCEHARVSGELLIVTGPPGAGKSTVATGVSELRTPSVLIEGDEFFRFLRAGRIEPWLLESDRQNEVVTDSAGAATGRFVIAGYWTVYDGVIGPWFLPRFVEAARLERVHYVVLLPRADTCVERVAHRIGHGFTDEAATRHMHSQFERADLPGRHVVRNSTANPADVIDEIAKLVASGRLTYPG